MRNLAEGGVREAAAVVVGIFDTHDQQIFPRLQQRGHLEIEGQIAAGMFADKLSVQPDRGTVVDRTEMQMSSLSSTRPGKAASIPGHPAGPPQIGKLRLPGHRHLCHTPLSQRVQALPVAGIKLKLPAAIQ